MDDKIAYSRLEAVEGIIAESDDTRFHHVSEFLGANPDDRRRLGLAIS